MPNLEQIRQRARQIIARRLKTNGQLAAPKSPVEIAMPAISMDFSPLATALEALSRVVPTLNVDLQPMVAALQGTLSGLTDIADGSNNLVTNIVEGNTSLATAITSLADSLKAVANATPDVKVSPKISVDMAPVAEAIQELVISLATRPVVGWTIEYDKEGNIKHLIPYNPKR